MKAARLLLALVLTALVIAALAQEAVPDSKPAAPTGPPVSTIVVPPPPEEPGGFRVSSDVELVVLDVSVRDSEGGFVSGLKKENFKVFDNKIEQSVQGFSAQDVPVTVGLIVDNSGSVRPKKPEIVTAALSFVKNSNPLDEVFIVNFNDRVKMGLPEDKPFSGDAVLLRDSLVKNPAQGRTALYDAIKTGLEHLTKGRLDKKTLVVISDGGDNSSEIDHDEMMRLAEESIATIYTVGIFNPEDKDKNPGFLKSIAKMTGGEAFMPENTKHLIGVCEKIAHDIRNRYTIAFVPSNSGRDGKVHRLRVLATSDQGKKYEVRTRTHYTAASDLNSRARGTTQGNK